jgi:two-component system, response regulator PdtaR
MGQVIRPSALIVDGETYSRELIATLLERAGLEVVEVDSSEEAVNILRVAAHEIVLIVAAMELPRFMNGARLAIYAQQWPWIRIVVTSDDQQSGGLPPPAVLMLNPWLPSDMVIEAEKAIAAASRR